LRTARWRLSCANRVWRCTGPGNCGRGRKSLLLLRRSASLQLSGLQRRGKPKTILRSNSFDANLKPSSSCLTEPGMQQWGLSHLRLGTAVLCRLKWQLALLGPLVSGQRQSEAQLSRNRPDLRLQSRFHKQHQRFNMQMRFVWQIRCERPRGLPAMPLGRDVPTRSQ
jgi:hypothetical protein